VEKEVQRQRQPEENEQSRESGNSEPADFRGSLAFENISFSYPGTKSEEILRDISFSIEAGSKTAIVGATGSGKTSLVNLIPRLYEPTAGAILIDGKDIRSIPITTLRELVGFVPQINFLFSDTIANNIGWGSRESTIDEIIAASHSAMLHEEIEEFPDAFETMLGEKGINLSGGQKQRTCIARAIAWNPRILVLDDALSAVDTGTEARLFDALLNRLPGTTVILISHRISTVKNCDRIMVLSEGRIAESGTHEELLARGELYLELYNQQLLEDEILSMN